MPIKDQIAELAGLMEKASGKDEQAKMVIGSKLLALVAELQAEKTPEIPDDVLAPMSQESRGLVLMGWCKLVLEAMGS